MAESNRVLVTGGSGYIASFCIAQLLNEGKQVRTTVRSMAREHEIRSTISSIAPAARNALEIVTADLNADAGWSQAVQGCQTVLHVASPVPAVNPKNDEELVIPARDGTLRVLTAAREAGTKRVVITSSTAAIVYGHGSRSQPFTEADWSDPNNRSDTSAYGRSKIIAERAAWEWHGREGGDLELVAICPGAVLGPVLGRDFSTSIEIIKKLIDGSLPALFRFGWSLVDVRDLADLHVRAATVPRAAGQRYIGGGPFYWLSDIAQIVRERVPELAGKVPSRRLPSWIVRLLAFDPVIRSRLFDLEKERPVLADKAKKELGWMPRPGEDTIEVTARSLLEKGLVRV